MSKNFIRADYSPKVIREAFAKVYHLDREQLLNPIIPLDTEEEDQDKTFLITTFHPNFRECDKIVQNNWDILGKIQLYPTPDQTKSSQGKQKGKET